MTAAHALAEAERKEKGAKLVKTDVRICVPTQNLIQRFAFLTHLPPANRRQNQNLSPVPDRRGQPARIAEAVAVDEDVDVGADFAELGHDAVVDFRVVAAEEGEGVGDGSGGAVD